MSYDLTVATSERVGHEAIEEWAKTHNFEVVAAVDGGSFTVRRRGKGDEGLICEVWGPDAAETDDFDELITQAMAAPRWHLSVSVPYSLPKGNQRLARDLASHLAQRGHGAALDPQESGILWPPGQDATVGARAVSAETSVLELTWFIAASRWRDAVDQLIPLLSEMPEALPTRYGLTEPLQRRFDRARPREFADFVADPGGPLPLTFWLASRPSFGGSAMCPDFNRHIRPEDERLRVGQMSIEFDAQVIGANARSTDNIVEVFHHGAQRFAALYAAGQVVPGYVVTRGNRLRSTGLADGEHFTRGALWQGLPPVPIWLSWYGDPYRELVDPAPGDVIARAGGILVRLSRTPLPREELPRAALPQRLTYKERRAVHRPDGSTAFEPARPEDRASFIPEIDPRPGRRPR